MKSLQIVSILISVLIFASSCSNEKDEKAEEFVRYVKALDIQSIKNICTEDTRFYIRTSFEPLLAFGDPKTLQQMQDIAASFECQGGDENRRCSFRDENGTEKSFEIGFVSNKGENNEIEWLIEVKDKELFRGSI